LFGFNLKHLLNLPRNLAGVLGKNGVQISMLARSTIDRFRRVENSVGAHPGGLAGWIFRGLFFIFLGIKPRHLLLMV
jgi:hypothetical protein